MKFPQRLFGARPPTPPAPAPQRRTQQRPAPAPAPAPAPPAPPPPASAPDEIVALALTVPDLVTLTAQGFEVIAERGVRVVNLSLAGPANSVLEDVVERLTRERDIVLVAAVGNAGPRAAPAYPAAYPGVIAVTAVDRDGAVYRRAIRDDHVDLAAVAGTRARDPGEAQGEPGGLRPDAPLAEAGDVVGPAQVRSDRQGRAALGGGDTIAREMRDRQKRIQSSGEALPVLSFPAVAELERPTEDPYRQPENVVPGQGDEVRPGDPPALEHRGEREIPLVNARAPPIPMPEVYLFSFSLDGRRSSHRADAGPGHVPSAPPTGCCDRAFLVEHRRRAFGVLLFHIAQSWLDYAIDVQRDEATTPERIGVET